MKILRSDSDKILYSSRKNMVIIMNFFIIYIGMFVNIMMV